MKIIRDTFRHTIIIRKSDENLDPEELVQELNDAFRAENDAYALEIDGLGKDDITQLHNALICANAPASLTKFVFENLNEAAERKFISEFRLWNVEILKKSGTVVKEINDTPISNGVLRRFDIAPQPQRATLPGINFFDSAKYVTIDPRVIRNAGHDQEAAATGIHFLTPKGGMK